MKLAELLQTSVKSSDQAYDLLRRPAKEVVVTVISDLERTNNFDYHLSHAVPIQYNLAGYSLHMDSFRAIIKQAVDACKERDLNVKAVAFDAQFLEVSVINDDEHPLTICKLLKQFWSAVQATPKAEKLASIMSFVPELPSITSLEDLSTNFVLTRSGVTGMTISLKETPQPIFSSFDIEEVSMRSKKVTTEEDSDTPAQDFELGTSANILHEASVENTNDCDIEVMSEKTPQVPAPVWSHPKYLHNLMKHPTYLHSLRKHPKQLQYLERHLKPPHYVKKHYKHLYYLQRYHKYR